MIARIRRHFQSDILRNATWMLGGQGLQMLGRFGYFVIVARTLGPAGYGTFVACTALVCAMSPFAPIGTGDVMIKYVARDRSALPVYLGNAFLVTVTLGGLLTAAALILRPIALPPTATATMLILVSIAELLGTQVLSICLQALLALEQASRYVSVSVFATALRLIAAVLLAMMPSTPMHWAYLYAGSALAATVFAVLVVSLCCAPPRLQLNLLVPSVREGFHFATALASQLVYTDIDKTMLARLSSVEAAAIYAVAQRFVTAAVLPIRSVAAATYPEFFRQGMRGVTSSFRFARRILSRSLLYGIAVSLTLFLMAGLVPYVMGEAYRESVSALRWLSALPLIRGVHAFLTDTLTGANYQWQRSSAQIAVAVFNVLLNLWIIRAYAWRGAAWSSLITDSLLVVLLYTIIRLHLRREKMMPGAAMPEPVFVGRGE